MFWRLRVGRAAVVGQRRRREAQAGGLAVAAGHGPVRQRGRRLAVVCRRQVARGRRAAERAESAGRLRLLGEQAALLKARHPALARDLPIALD